MKRKKSEELKELEARASGKELEIRAGGKELEQSQVKWFEPEMFVDFDEENMYIVISLGGLQEVEFPLNKKEASELAEDIMKWVRGEEQLDLPLQQEVENGKEQA